jgi:hypothetical protein
MAAIRGASGWFRAAGSVGSAADIAVLPRSRLWAALAGGRLIDARQSALYSRRPQGTLAADLRSGSRGWRLAAETLL